MGRRVRPEKIIENGAIFQDDRQRRNFAESDKYRQLINIDERQSAIISVALRHFYASAIRIKKTGYRSQVSNERVKTSELVREIKQAMLTSLSLNWLRYLGHDTLGCEASPLLCRW
ncbi:hypothetical protein [Microcoleus sp. Pol10D4]|uniref:hypothetical protein n=1 Tax=Microcoleus sp. Pol10D4 TaxID=3055387 RepID=UPI002FCF2E09